MIEVIKAEDIPNVGDYDINIYNAIIIPRGATNGNIIKAMFPNEVFKEISEYIEGQQVVSIFGKKSCMCFDVDWWNAPYKRGNENEVK